MTPTGLEKVQTTAVFDYSQLDEQTAQTLQNYSFRALQVARTYYRDLMEIVVGAHKLLCGTVAKEDTFRAWCASVHISKTKAYQLLQIQDFMDSCTPEQQSTLALLPFTAMRELVTGDTPEQVITMAKEGKVGTSKEVLKLKAQLKAEQERSNTAEARAKAASDKIDELDGHLAAALADVQGLSERNEKLLDERDEYIRTIRQLETRPVEVAAHDAEEIDRLAAERAAGLASARNAELAEENTALKEQLDALQEFVTDVSQDDFATAYHFVDSTKEAFMLMIPVILRLMEKDRGQVCRDLVELLSWMSTKTIILADGEAPRSVEYYDPDEEDDEWEEEV